MRRKLTGVLTLAILIGVVAISMASVKKRGPDKREVEGVLKKIGGTHFQEGMKIREVGMIETEINESEDVGGIKAYYWVFCTLLPDDSGYHVIIFDNEPRYLGYYKTELNPRECGEKTIVFDQGDFDLGADPITGEADKWSVEIPSSGPPPRININGPKEFVAAPTIEEVKEQKKEEREEAAATASVSTKKLEPEYRSWKIKVGEKMITVESAIFMEYKGGLVTIKDAKTGRTVTLPVRDFSEADQKYLRELIR